MTKEEFFKMRDEMRANGQLPVSNYVYEDLKLTPEEEQQALALLSGSKAGVYKTEGTFARYIKVNIDYVGEVVKVSRRQVDELDNVHIWMISK